MADAARGEAAAAAIKPEGDGAPVDSPGVDLTGRTLGEYQILRKIGAGGMGQVFLAQQLSLKRRVALKLLRKDLTGNPTAMLRFQAEAEAVARLNHPNIVQVYGAGESEGLRYMALEYVEGRNLREHLARKGPPDLPIALSIMRQVATALQKAHEQGLVHRDIKPENILVTKKVEVKVTDFGLSRFFTGGDAVSLTQSGVTLGTPLYLSPEQARGQPVDHRCDLYSFGVTCYHLLSGEPPFQGATAVEVALKHLTEEPAPLAGLRPDLPPDLCAMIHKLMAKKAEERYQTARDVLRDLAKVKEGMNLGLPPASPSTLPHVSQALSLSTSQVAVLPHLSASGVALAAPPAPTRGMWWLVGGFACLLAGALGALSYLHFHPKPPPATSPSSTATAGLPDIHLADPPKAPRERELLALLRDRNTHPDAWVSSSIELALLYLREGRLDESLARFESMEKESLAAPVATQSSRLGGRLGKAIVMAHRDNDPKHPQAPRASVKLFQEAFNSPYPNLIPKAKGDRYEAIRLFLKRHPDLAQAAAEAIRRDAINGARLPAVLDSLRWPRPARKKK